MRFYFCFAITSNDKEEGSANLKAQNEAQTFEDERKKGGAKRKMKRDFLMIENKNENVLRVK